MKLINIGFGNLVSDIRIVSIVLPESAPVKRLVQEAREKGMLIDATYGRKTKSVIVTDSEHIILSALPPETIMQRQSGVKDTLIAYEERIDQDE
ncbi:MAG: DUF370 domain-containing protein [Clostridia bacterium]|nr:DUF370 domain-containing protein [Clostridia bacterium]